MILGILYESFVHPVTILTGLPFALFGALLTLLIFRVDLNIYSFVGLIMLIGVVKKNAIMMIDFAIDAQRKGGLDAEAAILKACSIRFRPIMMTTMAALMGTLPIALGLGAGAEGAAAAGPVRGGRPAVLAADHAVRDAGVLHLPGPIPGAAGPREGGSGLT